MFGTIVLLIVLYCMLNMLARAKWWLVGFLVLGAVIDPYGARIFFQGIFFWLGEVWHRILFVLGFN